MRWPCSAPNIPLPIQQRQQTIVQRPQLLFFDKLESPAFLFNSQKPSPEHVTLCDPVVFVNRVARLVLRDPGRYPSG